MRLTEGIVVDSGLTFGKVRFSALRRKYGSKMRMERLVTKVKERTYNLKSSAQGRMIQVSIPANVPLREFAYDAEVGWSIQLWIQSPIMFSRRNYC